MVTRHRFIFIGLCVVSVALVIAAPAHAQSAAVLDDIVTQFQSRAAGWEGALRSFALNTFGILAAIELAWAAFRLAFRGADVSEWLAEIVNQIFFLGFFLALLENSVTWGQAIVNSFRQAASTAGGTGLAPSDVFTAGVDLAQKVMSQMSIWSPAASVGLIIAGLVIEVCFALITACMVLALVESYLVISMGVLFMAFGGTQWTKDFRDQHRPLHVVSRRKALRASAIGQHRRRPYPELGSYVQRYHCFIALHPCRLLDRDAGASQGAA